MKEKAIENFKNGYGCSESIVKAAIDEGLCHESLFRVSSAFRGGMASGCLCGAIAGSQMVLGSVKERNEVTKCAKHLIDEFKKNHKATCCRVLTAGMDMASPERKAHCAEMVAECAEILEKMIETEVKA